MSQVLEEINRELLSELYELKKQLKTAEFKIQEKDKKIEKLEKPQTANNEETEEIEAKLAAAEEKIKDLLKKNMSLNQTCYNLKHDNINLTQQFAVVSSQNNEQARKLNSKQMRNLKEFPQIHTLQQVESQMMSLNCKETNEGYESESDQQESEGSQTKEEHLEEQEDNSTKADEQCDGTYKHKHKLSTIAKKLKLSLAKDHFQPEEEVTLAAQVLSPRLKKQLMEKQVRSILIGGLFRGLTKENIVDHFTQFGKVVTYSEPQKSFAQNDGTKFVFLKFDNCSAADKAVEKPKHTIKDVNVIAMKSYKDL